MGLETATDGEVMFNGKDIAQEQVQKRSPQQVGSMQMVFQKPFDTLNTRHSVGSQLDRVIRKFCVEINGKRIKQRVMEMLDMVKMLLALSRVRPTVLYGVTKKRYSTQVGQASRKE